MRLSKFGRMASFAQALGAVDENCGKWNILYTCEQSSIPDHALSYEATATTVFLNMDRERFYSSLLSRAL